MSLIVENGATSGGTPSAESYVSVAEADAYWSARSNATWAAATTDAKEAALRAACAYLDVAYRWRGARTWVTQVLYWPRVLTSGEDDQTVSSTTIPQVLKNAQFELALAALSGDLAPAQSGQKVQSQSLGALSVSYYQGDEGRRFPLVDMLLRDFVFGKTTGAGTVAAQLS